MIVSPSPHKPGDKLVIRTEYRPPDDDGFEPHGIGAHDGAECEVIERNPNGNYRVKLAGGEVLADVPHDAVEAAPPEPPAPTNGGT